MPDIRKSPELDDFNYVLNPIELGGLWEKWGIGAVRANGSAFHPAQAGSPGFGDSFYNWKGIAGNGDVEVWGLATGSPDFSEGWRIGLVQSNGGAASAEGNGYQVLISGGAGGGWSVRRYDGGGFTAIHGVNGGSIQGAHCLIRTVGDLLEGWISTDGGASWTNVFSITDGTYRTRLSPGLGMSSDDGTQESWTSFGGGILYRTQIYRYVSN